jgi:hypothetical protein
MRSSLRWRNWITVPRTEVKLRGSAVVLASSPNAQSARVAYSDWAMHERAALMLQTEYSKQRTNQHYESPQDCRRLPIVRGWEHGETHTVFS